MRLIAANDDDFHDRATGKLAHALDVSSETVRRWKRTGQVPDPMRRLAGILLDGDLGLVHPHWAAFRLRDDCLYLPNGYRFSRGMLEAYEIQLQRISELQRLVDRR